jgi:hypothetical protein
LATNALRSVATIPGQKPPKYAAIMTAGKNVIWGTAFPRTGHRGQRISNETAVANSATPYLANGCRGRSCMRASIEISIAMDCQTA